jgi:hypothetical protein
VTSSSRVLLTVLAIAAALVAVQALRVHEQRSRAEASAGEPGGARYRLDAAAARRDGAAVLDARRQAAGFGFAPATAPADREAFLAAVAGARPEARRLVGLVDGLVDVRVGPAGAGRVGTTVVGGDRYPMTVDLAQAWRRSGRRGVDRLVLHELGHVVDHALLPDALTAPLVAAVPAGWGCADGRTGACTEPEERFAESFAKWAVRDIGVDLDLGYAIPPPEPSLEAWGRPLAAWRG